MNTLTYAKRYLELGYHCIPLGHKSKIPPKGFELKKYQKQAPTDEEITSWFSNGNGDRNIGLLMGRGIFAVDLDGEGAESALTGLGIEIPQFAPRSKTGRGQHILLAASSPVGDAVALLHSEGKGPDGKWLWAVDIRGVGYIVAEPSIHDKLGTPYKWIVKPPHVSEIPNAPKDLLGLISKSKSAQGQGAPTVADSASGEGWIIESLRGVSEGNRDAICAKLAGYFLAKKIPQAVVIETLNTWALRCTPPFDGVVKTVKSIAAKDGENNKPGKTVAVQSLKEITNEIWDDLNANKKDCSPTGFSGIDEKLSGGVRPGELVYLGARPAVGKTAFALQTAVAWANCGRKVLIVSREMSNVALGRRMVSQIGKVNASRLRKGEGQTGVIHDQEKVLTTLDRMRDMNIWMTEKAVTMADIKSSLEASGADALIADHLQLIASSNSRSDRRHQLEEVSAAMKGLALDKEIPIMCMSTLSRPLAGVNVRPTLASLRESGELEHDADIVMLIHREWKSFDATVIIAKNREGMTGDVEFIFVPEFLNFSEKIESAPKNWQDRD